MMFIRHGQTGAIEARQRSGSWGGLNPPCTRTTDRRVRDAGVTKNVANTWSSTARSASETSCITTMAVYELSGGTAATVT